MKMKTCIVEILLLLTLVANIEPVGGVPANPTPFTFIQPDQSSFEARQIGDERAAHFETMDGYTIVKDENNWWNYARKDANGKLVSTGQRVGFADAKILGVQKHLHPSVTAIELSTGEEQIPDKAGLLPSRITMPLQVPQTGTKKALVILINFTDASQNPGSTPPYYENLLFNTSPGANSMNNYYKEVSYNKINVTGTIAGNRWFSAANNLAWYGNDVTDIDENQNLADPNNWYIFKLAKEAVIAADPYVDYTQYDTNSDGVIDSLIIVHAGNGQESSGVSTDIWSHKWSIYVWGGSEWSLGYMTADGVKAIGYTMIAENSPLGTFAHEFGHDLGLPDLYDTDYSSYGVGYWDIMAGGSWLNSGNTPAHLSAWSKYFLSWVNPTKVKATLRNEQISQSETNDDVYMLLDNPGDSPGSLDWTRSGTGTGEYFLVENRRKTGYDAYLPGEGLLIWHIDETRGNNTNENRKLVDLEEADGLNHLDTKTNYGDVNDPWYSSATGFTEATNPNSSFYNGSASGIRITNISASASIITENLIVSWPPPIITFVSPTPGNNSNLLQNWVYVKITSDETLNIALLEWNGTNETMQDSGITWYKNKTNLAEGVYTYRVWANDSAGNFNVSETRYVIIDLPPSITFVSLTPANNSILNRNWTYVNISSDQILNISLLKWNGTNETMQGSGITWYKNKTDLSDGNHSYRVWSNDSTNNWNATEIRVVMVDTTPPVGTANPTGYPAGQTAAKNGTAVTLNTTITDAISGVKNASVNVSAINASLTDISLTNVSGFWINSSVIVNASDGTYNLNITAYDNAGNLNNTAQISVIVDNTPPNVTVYPASYQRGNATNNGSIIGFNISASDNLAGLKNASVNASLINNTGSIELINQSGFWKGNATFDKFKPDGFYLLNVTFFDNAGNLNDSAQINVSIDNTPPSVSEVSVSSSYIEVGSFINITANITDTVSQVNPDEVFSRVTYPNGTSINHAMRGDSSLFYLNFTDTEQYGRFDVTILANDTTGNMNNTQKTRFATVFMTINTNVVTQENISTVINAPHSNTTLLLLTNKSSSGAINISQSKVNISSLELTIINPGIYVLVNASESIKNNLSYVVICVNYTDAEVSSYVESSLRLYKWNTASMNWDKLSGPGSYSYVNDAGVDTVNNFVWANLTSLSEFAVAGELYVPPTPPPTVSPSPSPTVPPRGGGGGGGGAALAALPNVPVDPATGAVTSTTTLTVNGAALTIPAGTIVRDAEGNPLSTPITMLYSPSIAETVGALNAYDYGPIGTTFVPSIDLVITYDPADLPGGFSESDLVVRMWDGTAWTNLETTVDTVAHTATAKASHFTLFALFAVPRVAPSPTPIPTVTPEATPEVTLTPTPTLQMPGIRVVAPIAVVIALIIVAVAYLLLKRRAKL